MKVKDIKLRFCAKYSNEGAHRQCQCTGARDQEPHEFIPTSTYYTCAYGGCKGYKCQICDKFAVIG